MGWRVRVSFERLAYLSFSLCRRRRIIVRTRLLTVACCRRPSEPHITIGIAPVLPLPSVLNKRSRVAELPFVVIKEGS